MIDLEQPGNVNAIQINYFDHESDLYGRISGLRHRYVIEESLNGNDWKMLIDKSNSFKDSPNDYVELETPVRTRYLRYRNVDVPTLTSPFRIFEFLVSERRKAGLVTGFSVMRESDRRDALITWNAIDNAQGYNIRWGIKPDKLYSSWLVYGDTQLLLKALTTNQEYYFTIRGVQ